MNKTKIMDNLSEHDKATLTMALLFQKLKPEQKNYIAAMSEGMVVTNEILEKLTDTQKN